MNEEYRDKDSIEKHSIEKHLYGGGEEKSGMNKGRNIAIVLALLIATNSLTAFVSNRVSFKITKKNEKSSISINRRPSQENIDRFSKLFVVKDKIEKYYYGGKIDENKLVEGAIKGMTDSLNDPYTTFMNEKEFSSWNTETEGKYVGVGIQVGVVDNKIVIIAPFEDSPAYKAGIKPGDIIQKVSDIAMTGKEMEKAVAIMKNGKKGEKVKLTLYREGKGSFDVDVVRDEIMMQTVKSEVINKDIGYIRISMFDDNTAANFNKHLLKLEKKGARGLILDLRGNPGGLVDQCVSVASNFIPTGKTIVYTIDKYNKKKVYPSEGGIALDIPVVILTDAGTASASEILSGALKDYKKATLIGEKTFGKGIVQTVLYRNIDGLGDGTALKVTISGYYTPNGINIHKKGISPDIKVVYPKELYNKPYDRNIDPQFKKALEVMQGKMKK